MYRRRRGPRRRPRKDAPEGAEGAPQEQASGSGQPVRELPPPVPGTGGPTAGPRFVEVLSVVPGEGEPPPAVEPPAEETPVDAPPGTLKLACDAMLGRLSRDLRALGVDCSYRRGLGGLRAWQKARADERLLLTRNNKLKDKEGVVFVEARDGKAQLEEVRQRFGIEGPASVPEPEPKPEPRRRPAPAPAAPVESGPRCRDCNVALERITREQARPSIPFFIYQIHHEFARCPKCKRVFWPGSHTREPQERPAEGEPRPRRRRRSR